MAASNVYEFCGNNPIMGADPSGLDEITAQDLLTLRKLYGETANISLRTINAIVRDIKHQILSAKPGNRSSALRATLWAASLLGSHDYDVTASLDMGPVMEDFGLGRDKCNAFVFNAYHLGAGVPSGNGGLPTTTTKFLWSHHTWPPGAKGS